MGRAAQLGAALAATATWRQPLLPAADRVPRRCTWVRQFAAPDASASPRRALSLSPLRPTSRWPAKGGRPSLPRAPVQHRCLGCCFGTAANTRLDRLPLATAPPRAHLPSAPLPASMAGRMAARALWQPWCRRSRLTCTAGVAAAGPPQGWRDTLLPLSACTTALAVLLRQVEHWGHLTIGWPMAAATARLCCCPAPASVPPALLPARPPHACAAMHAFPCAAPRQCTMTPEAPQYKRTAAATSLQLKFWVLQQGKTLTNVVVSISPQPAGTQPGPAARPSARAWPPPRRRPAGCPRGPAAAAPAPEGHERQERRYAQSVKGAPSRMRGSRQPGLVRVGMASVARQEASKRCCGMER